MPETSKNKWIAVMVSLIVAAFFFGAVFFYLFNSKVSEDVAKAALEKASAPSTMRPAPVQLDLNKNVITPTKPTMITENPTQLVITDERLGTGAEAKAGQTVSVNYIGTLTNGTKFDSSYDRGQPIQFVLGSGQVIKGWDQGILGMKVGGKRKLVIPADLAYGNRAVGDVIPANAVLVFEVELVAVK